jgi:hypothetical protein
MVNENPIAVDHGISVPRHPRLTPVTPEIPYVVRFQQVETFPHWKLFLIRTHNSSSI